MDDVGVLVASEDCIADHATVPIDYRACPVCRQDLGRPAPVPLRRLAPPHDVDLGARVGTTAAKRARSLGSTLVDIGEWLMSRGLGR